MENYFKITAGILITMILCLLLPKQKMEISVLLSVSACCMALICSVVYLEPLISLFQKIVMLGNLPEEHLRILFKVVGVGLISQISGVICMDTGIQSLAKVLQVVASIVILWLCIPLLEQLLDLIEKILGAT